MRHLFIKILVFLSLFLLLTAYLQAKECIIPSSKASQEAYIRVAPRLIYEMQKMNINLGDPVFIRIFKNEKQLEIWIQEGLTYKLFKTYSICNHSGTLGPKLKEGDKQSPEGFYTVRPSQLNPYSNYHLSFNLGFPNEFDRSHNRTGSVLMVHGSCSSVGCFAMTDFRIEEIYTIIESAMIAGQLQVPIHIFPFRMTWENMAAHNDSKWIPFWENLKQGYDYFEGNRAPPLVTIQEKRYQFLTFRPLLFGGNLPSIAPDNNYAQLKPITRTTDAL